MLKIENGKFELVGKIWTVLEKTEQGFLCIADSIGDKVFGKTNDWRESYIRKFLNTEFLEKIENEIGTENVIEFERNLLSLDGQTEYGSCMDKVSIISAFEYIEHRKLLPNTNNYWWTLTADSTHCNNDNWCVRVVSPSGYFDIHVCDGSSGVRPVCIFSSSIFESGE